MEASSAGPEDRLEADITLDTAVETFQRIFGPENLTVEGILGNDEAADVVLIDVAEPTAEESSRS